MPYMRLVFNFAGGAARAHPLTIDECNGTKFGPLGTLGESLGGTLLKMGGKVA
jgi:hypothetical protein